MNDLKREKLEVGAANDEYRLWAAKEAQRQAEGALAAQTANLLAAETRASSLIGWTIAGALAGVALLGGHQIAHSEIILSIIGSPVILAITACVVALWPKPWNRATTDLAWILKQQEPSDCELNTLEAMANGYLTAIEQNESRLTFFSKAMKIAWGAFVAIPFAAIIAFLFFG